MAQVLFVCEHGAAKSVLAATYFNHLAEQLGLHWRALARGTAPDTELPRPVLEGLTRAGLAPCTLVPTLLGSADLGEAERIVSFDRPELARLVPRPESHLRWDGLPPVSADFEIARAAIFAKVQGLLAELARDSSATEA
jgi:protein-tyrosine-phosphatase